MGKKLGKRLAMDVKRIRKLKSRAKPLKIKIKTKLAPKRIKGYVSAVDYALAQAQKRELARKKYEQYRKLISQPY